MQPERSSHTPTHDTYLWLNCEGWVKFGPFPWLTFDSTHSAILSPDGIVAWLVDQRWRVPSAQYKGFQFTTSFISSSQFAPNPNRGSLPVPNSSKIEQQLLELTAEWNL